MIVWFVLEESVTCNVLLNPSGRENTAKMFIACLLWKNCVKSQDFILKLLIFKQVLIWKTAYNVLDVMNTL